MAGCMTDCITTFMGTALPYALMPYFDFSDFINNAGIVIHTPYFLSLRSRATRSATIVSIISAK